MTPRLPAVRGLSRVAARLAPRSFRSRIVWSTVALVTVAMVLVGLGLQFVLDYTAQRDIRQVLSDRSQAMVKVIRQASGTTLTVPRNALEPGMVVYDTHGNRIAGSVEHQARGAAEDLSRTTTVRSKRGPEDAERLLGTPFTTTSGESGVLVVSQEASPYERSEFYALIATIVLAVLVIAGTALIALRVTRQALAPVTQMAERAADWSEHDLTHRFDLGAPSNELAALGETLDHLLDRVASAIRSEQRLTAELAHELRTPLTAIQASADLALLRGVEDEEARGDFEQISLSAREMTGVIATLLDIAREGSAGYREQAALLGDVMKALTSAVPEELRVVEQLDDSAAAVRVAAPRDLIVRAVAPLVDNAARHAASTITLSAAVAPDRVDLVVADDGPGVPADLRDTLFEAGVTRSGTGAGLGLGIARRAAGSFGGSVELVPSSGDRPGAAFRVRLPRR